MALLKVSEFAEAYDIPRPNVYTYQKRGKLIIIDGYVDTDNQINQMFLSHRQSVIPKQAPKKQSKQTKIPDKQQLSESKVYTDTEKKVRTITEQDSKPINSFLLKSEELKQKKLEEDILTAKIKNERTIGKLVNKEDIGLMLNAYLSRFTMNLVQQVDVLIRDSMNELQADNIQIKKACAKLIDVTNDCQELALKEIEIGFNNMSND